MPQRISCAMSRRSATFNTAETPNLKWKNQSSQPDVSPTRDKGRHVNLC